MNKLLLVLLTATALFSFSACSTLDKTADYVKDLAYTAADPVTGEVLPSSIAQTGANALNAIPGIGGLASLLANGALVIGGVWLNSKRKTGNKINESLVTGIDVFRDVLDATPQGNAIDTRLIEVLSKRQAELGTLQAVNKLLDRYATATKVPIELEEVPNTVV